MRRPTPLTSLPLLAALLLPAGAAHAAPAAAVPAAASMVAAPVATGVPAHRGAGVSAQEARVFAEDSFWYRTLPADTPVAENSAQIVAGLVRQAETHYGQPGRPNVTINTSQYTPTIYTATAADPVVEVGFHNCQNKPAHDLYVQRMFTGPDAPMKKVRIPAHAVPAAGNDAEMIVIDPIEDRLVELWKVTKKADGSWTACWGVVQEGVSQASGTFERPFGVTAAGISMLGGTILADELREGRIDHVIGLALPFSAPWPTVSAPANRSDGRNPQGLAVPAQGQLLRLPADLDLDAMPMHPTVRAVARAAQDHGIVIWDTAGAVSFRAENRDGFAADPYPGILDGTWPMVLMQQFPLDQLEVLPMDYQAPLGEPEPQIEAAEQPAPTAPTERPVPSAPVEETLPEAQEKPAPPRPGARQVHRAHDWSGSASDVVTVADSLPGDRVFSGDWDGDGVDTLALRRGNEIRLWNGEPTGDPDHVFWYGTPGDHPLVGDWDGDGVDTFAVRRGNVLHLRNSHASGNADHTFAYGRADDAVLIGDWDGDGVDTFAMRRGNEYHVSNHLRGGVAEVRFWYGTSVDEAMIGDLDGDGKDSLSIRRGAEWHLRNTLTSGNAERVVVLGRVGDDALLGDWTGTGKDTAAIVR